MTQPTDNFLEVMIDIGKQLGSDDISLGLVAVMTKSAFGHEYALMHLSEDIPYTKRQQILAQLEAHKKTYFLARERLEKVNPEKLVALEEELRLQKESILRNKPVTLH